MAAFLFKVKENIVIPNAETLLISPYKEIWRRDKTAKKVVAIQEFAYIEFMASQKSSNPFKDYPEIKTVVKIVDGEKVEIEITEKHNKIVERVIKDKNWKPDKLVLEGIEELKVFQTEASLTYTYYMSAKSAANNMSEFFESVDLSARSQNGSLILKPKDLTNALIDSNKVLATLKDLEKKVVEELFDTVRTQADKKVSYFAKISSLK